MLSKEEMEQRLAQFEALTFLLASECAYVNKVTPDGFWAGQGLDATGRITFNVMCSDTFAYACSDSEEFPLEMAPELVKVLSSEGWPGLVRWVQEKRGGSEKSPFIKRVRNDIDAHDSALKGLKERAEKAEAALAKRLAHDAAS